MTYIRCSKTFVTQDIDDSAAACRKYGTAEYNEFYPTCIGGVGVEAVSTILFDGKTCAVHVRQISICFSMNF